MSFDMFEHSSKVFIKCISRKASMLKAFDAQQITMAELAEFIWRFDMAADLYHSNMHARFLELVVSAGILTAHEIVNV